MAVLQGPAVGVKDLLERPGKGRFGREAVVDGEDGNVQLNRPFAQVNLVRFGALCDEATAVAVEEERLGRRRTAGGFYRTSIAHLEEIEGKKVIFVAFV